VGENIWGGSINASCSTATVSGNGKIGGLVGMNIFGGSITDSYSRGPVIGDDTVGGLVGENWGDNSITFCYSTGAVSGDRAVGGLVGSHRHIGLGGGSITSSFWDIETSGQTTSVGGIGGKTTAQMQTANTFLGAGWDFVKETENGIDDIWWILEGQDYPRLWWELIPEN
jgi:hypothetical protein